MDFSKMLSAATCIAIALGAEDRVSAAPRDDVPRYTVQELAPVGSQMPGAEMGSRGHSINRRGEVAGGSARANGDRAPTLWLPEAAYGLPAGPNDLGDLGVPGGSAYGMNDVGQVVGFAEPPGGGGWATAFLWDPVTGLTDLGSLGGTHSIAHAISNAGQVVGESDPGSWTTFLAAVLWDGSQMIDLGAFDQGAFQSRAEDINESGQVAGHSMYLDDVEDPEASRLRAFLWLPEPAYGLPAGLNDIDDRSSDNPRQISVAKGLNDRGQVVVWGSNPIFPNGSHYAAFWLWLPEPDYGLPAGMNDLRGPYGIRDTAFAHDINARGEAVFRGSVDPENPLGDWRALLWRQGEWFDLHQCIPPEDQADWFFGSATDINDRGEICGWGFYRGRERGFKLTPVTDEPAACPADITEDRVVDTADLIEVLAEWGEAGGHADVNGDGVVDIADLLAVLTTWGPCEPLGACCFDFTGDCQALTEVDCSFLGGVWDGGETCETTACPEPPTGACCFFPSAECTDLSEFQCHVAGGTWHGAASDCGAFACPEAPVGDWIGDPIVITALPYSTGGNTSAFNGWYDEHCELYGDAPEVVYAYTPSADEIVNISLCEGSTFDTKLYVYEDVEGNTVACDDDTCTTPSVPLPYVSRIESLALTAGSTYYIVVDGGARRLNSGIYTLDVWSSTPGACCLPSEECEDWSVDLCEAAGGTWFGTETCEDFVCPPLPRGACCLPDGTCVSNQTEYECLDRFGGVWQGEGVSCLEIECP